MPDAQEPQKLERSSTYMVQDRQNQQELRRLTVQDQLVTASMGGVLPEQPDAPRFRRILDVGCGTGGWAIEAAKTYPNLSLVGIDISDAMIGYAQAQATEQGLADRVEFRVMDALQMLEFRANTFDLVNMRLSLSWMRTWNWPKMLTEMQRVLLPNGVIRLTESDIIRSNSPMFTKWMQMALRGTYRAGYSFSEHITGITTHLAPLLTQYGLQQVQTKGYDIEYRGSTPEGEMFREDWTRAMKTLRPFLQKWGGIPADYDEICEQAAKDMQQSDFHATWNIFTAWGKKPL